MILPEPSKLFARFAMDAGTDGAARDQFQLLVTNLIKVKHPDATSVEGPGGRDWGIDTFAGQLAGGAIRIWQSKFVLEWKDATPQGQVRSSFASALEHAKAHGHTITAWTLVVPTVLPPDQYKWFAGWAKREGLKHHVAIDIWDGTELRHQLLNRDAEDVRREYFPHTMPAMSGANSTTIEQVQITEDMTQFEGALFLRQLREAGQIETDSACAHFYATDALVRDYVAKGQPEAIASMDELHLEVRDIWEREFNKQVGGADTNGRMPALLDLVLASAAKCENPPGLFLARAHKKGTAHRLVEQRQAGWVTHWRQVAGDHGAAAAAGSDGGQHPAEHDEAAGGLADVSAGAQV